MDRKKRLGYLLVALAVTLACVPTLPVVAPLPTQPVGAVETMIAGTYAAASTGTALQITPTSTPFDTPTPSKTPTITPTGTATTIFHYYTPTPLPISGGGGGGKAPPSYACKLLSITPPHASVYPPGMAFVAIWEIKNTGDTFWDQNSVDYLYRGGAFLSDPAKQVNLNDPYDTHDLPGHVLEGKSVELTVDMIAPATPGMYTTTWSLHVGDKYFCTVKLTIVVQ
jgi:hypothetical protein